MAGRRAARPVRSNGVLEPPGDGQLGERASTASWGALMSHDSRPHRRPDPGARGGAPLSPLLAALLAVGAVAILFLAGVLAQRYTGTEAAATTVTTRPSQTVPAKPTSRPPPPPGVGDAVRDGKFEFVVTRVDCSQTSVGLEHFRRTAKGKYCVVGLSV